MKEPKQVVYDEKDLGSIVSYGSSNGNSISNQSRYTGGVNPDLKQSENAGHTVNHLENNGQKLFLFPLTPYLLIVNPSLICSHLSFRI